MCFDLPPPLLGPLDLIIIISSNSNSSSNSGWTMMKLQRKGWGNRGYVDNVGMV